MKELQNLRVNNLMSKNEVGKKINLIKKKHREKIYSNQLGLT
jgi:hypothetical protein